jgi:hypothetical protein
LGRVAARALGEGEFEGELEDEFEGEAEAEAERQLTEGEAMAELMAAVAAQASSEAEAEAMIGAATMTTLSARDRAALRAILPNLVRASCVLARLLRRRRDTRPALRVVPTIVRRSARVLAARNAAGQPVSRRYAARVLARQTRRVLASPRRTSSALARNIRISRAMRRAMGTPRYRSVAAHSPVNGRRPVYR